MKKFKVKCKSWAKVLLIGDFTFGKTYEVTVLEENGHCSRVQLIDDSQSIKKIGLYSIEEVFDFVLETPEHDKRTN